MDWSHSRPPAGEADNNLLPEVMVGLAIEPRPYQLRIISKAVRMFRGEFVNRHGEREPEAGSVMIESPTGSGKTVMGLTVARHLQRLFGYSVGWVAMRRNLLSQADEENRRRGFNVEMKLISMFDKSPPPVDVLVVDEAQHDAAMSMANLHCTVRPKKVLGLSATPYRTDRIKLCFDKVITDAGIHQLIQDGYLSRYRHFTIPEHTPESVARFYAAEPERWGKSLIFFHRLEECEACRELLAAAGQEAEVVTAKSNRDRQLDAFLAGRVNVLINMAILTEGFDCPRLATVFCRPSGKSCTIQMGGRVFRKHAELPLKQIVQCRKTPHPFIKTAMADEQYVWVDGAWRTLTLNRSLNAITQNARRVVAMSKAELPKVVAAHRTRPLPWERVRRVDL
ncbi:MAG: DEAD/DEAH box helicase family protein [Planctomycetes bacterium]|nr:DEAD/DEAH box helicase family protein [Planctomycetota bacterium]